MGQMYAPLSKVRPIRPALRRGAFAVSIVSAAVIACDGTGPIAPDVEKHPDIRAYVVLDAAQALDSDGRFEIHPDITPNPESDQLVSAARASQLGRAFVKSFGPAFLRVWERDRGAKIDLTALTANPRVYPVQTPFAAAPKLGCHPAYVRVFGSFYLVTFDDQQEPQMLLAVSAQLSDFDVDINGDIVLPVLTGTDFLHSAIPVSAGRLSPLSPEQAVALAARATGAQIRSVPTMVRRDMIYWPPTGLWEVVLDRDVPVVRKDGSQSQKSVIYVSPFQNERFLIAADVQPESASMDCLKIDEQFENDGFATLTVPLNERAAISFIPVAVIAP